MSTAAKPRPESEVITRAELRELAEWETKAAKAKRDLAEAEKQLYPRRLQLAQKVLGVEIEADYRAMDPQKIEKVMLSRFDKGLWRAATGAMEFSFVKTYEGRPTSWKDVALTHLGELEVARIAAATPKLFSYKVEVWP